MKKVKPKQGNVTSKRAPKKSGSRSKKSNGIDPGEILGKLNGQQLLELGNSLVSLGHSGVDLLKEKEITAQVHAEVSLGIERVNADREKVRIEHQTKRLEIDAYDKQDTRKHTENMSELTSSHNQMMNILKQVDEGKIPAELLIGLISKIKRGAD